MAHNGIIVGLDIGTTKVCAVLGEQNENGIPEITGIGSCPCAGLRKGVVVNIEATLRSVTEAIEAAELMSGIPSDNIWTGIGGSNIDGIISRGVVAVNGKSKDNREISQNDVDRVIEGARAVDFSMDREVLEVIPQTFIVDGHPGIRDPRDMIGVRLESEVHIITCSRTSAQNLVNCINRAGFEVNGLVLQTLAAGRAVMTEEEKELGSALIDLGGGTTGILVYHQGTANMVASVPLGASQVTSDISIVKNIAFETAEKVKTEAGCCWAALLEGVDEDIVVPGMGGRSPFPIPRSEIVQIVQPRMVEIFQLAKEKIYKQITQRTLGGGIVLTGGGANLEGVADLAAKVFGLPVRIGSPLSFGGLVDEYRDPSFAVAVGLVLEGNDRTGNISGAKDRSGAGRQDGGNSIFSRIAEWIKKEVF
ncbi:MAG: cell division protein FtsA [Termitinemataceae bacterium]|nr:MAG: cell division protein FtsA [Termitinemataceae bacterium]